MSTPSSSIILQRDVTAVQVPSGVELELEKGMEVYVLQELGGDFTVETALGIMYRIEARDADVLGRESSTPVEEAAVVNGELVQEVLWRTLATCYDPEIPVDIVELGLVYSCVTEKLSNGNFRVHVDMTLTAPGCGMAQVLMDDVKRKLERLEGISEARVNLVFEPPWNPEMMSEAARLQAGLY